MTQPTLREAVIEMRRLQLEFFRTKNRGLLTALIKNDLRILINTAREDGDDDLAKMAHDLLRYLE